MASGVKTVFACVWILCPFFLQSAVGDRCSGDCPCELGEACFFSANVTSTLQIVYQLNETTENQVRRCVCLDFAQP